MVERLQKEALHVLQLKHQTPNMNKVVKRSTLNQKVVDNHETKNYDKCR